MGGLFGLFVGNYGEFKLSCAARGPVLELEVSKRFKASISQNGYVRSPRKVQVSFTPEVLMSHDDAPSPAEHAGLDLPWEEITHPTVFQLLNSFRSNREAVGIRHPEQTITCPEKLEMFRRHAETYAPYGQIRIARASLLLVKRAGVKSNVLYMSDGENRIDFKALRHQFGLGKKDDLRSGDGDIEKIVGLPRGGLSPFVGLEHELSQIVFGLDLSSGEHVHPHARWDFAFGLDVSVLIRPTALFSALKSLSAPGAKILGWAKIMH